MKRRYRLAPWAQVYVHAVIAGRIQLSPGPRLAPHRAWGARQMDQMTDILGWRDAVAMLKPLVGRGAG